MKKILLTIFCALTTLCVTAQSKSNYTEQYVATVNEEVQDPESVDITVVDNGNGTVNVTFCNFVLHVHGKDVPISSVDFNDIPTYVGEDGLTHFKKEGTFTPDIPADYRYVLVFIDLCDYLKDIPFTIEGKMNAGKFYAVLNFTIYINELLLKVDDKVSFEIGSENLSDSKFYKEQLLVTVNGESSEPQNTIVNVENNGDGTINFVLNNFMLEAGEESMPVGNICVENISTTVGNDGLTYFIFTGNITIQAGDKEGIGEWYGPMLGEIPVVLQGKMNDEKLYVTIDIDMQSTLQQIVYVQLGTDDFTVEGKIYTEPLVVTINGESSAPQDASVTVVDNGDGTINFVLNNFMLEAGEESMPVGNICVENISTTVGSDGLTYFSFTGNITIQSGDKEGIEEWYGPILGEIPVVLQGKMNDEKLYVTIDIDMQSTLQQIVYVQLGTDDFAVEGKIYTEPLVVTINGESSAPQDASVTVVDNGDGTINFVLNNFMLEAGEESMPVGNICVENISTTVGNDGLTYFTFTGNITIQAGDKEGIGEWYGPMLGEIPVVLRGKMNDEKLYVTIDIDMQSTLQQIVYVQLGTDNFFSALGDLNGDEKVDIADAVTVLNIMAAGEYKAEADVNHDQKVDIADFVTILNIMAAQ